MQIRMTIAFVAALALTAWCVPAEAKLPPQIAAAIATAYPPAAEHYGLKSAHQEPDPGKLRGFAVIERGGIPAERARYFVSWEDYDYRGVQVNLAKGDEVSTRRGKIYTYLQRGDVMAVAGTEEFGRTIYLKLLSADVYVPEGRMADKRFSRVTVMLGFTFPKEVFKNDDAEAVLAAMAQWVKPFPNVDDAKAYARRIKDERFVVQKVDEAGKVGDASKASKASKAGKAGKAGKAETAGTAVAAVPPAEAAALPVADAKEEARMKGLEEKIEAAKKQMEEAEREMKALKQEQQKLK